LLLFPHAADMISSSADKSSWLGNNCRERDAEMLTVQSLWSIIYGNEY